MDSNQTITITFGDQAENHVGMKKIGIGAQYGFSLNDLIIARDWFISYNINAVVYDLNESLYISEKISPLELDNEAYILVVRNGVQFLLEPENSIQDLHNELINLKWDTKALMYGRVCNKNARYNLCFGDKSVLPNYENGQGRVVSFKNVEILNKIKNLLCLFLGESANDLVAEGNYYYDVSKCGISYHGDSERKKVVGIRLGASMPLVYQWYHNATPASGKMKFNLHDGDIYIMSEKAVGFDWKKKSSYTLRHAAGSDTFINKN